MQSISGIGNFGYDANGNLLTGGGRTISWNSFDMPVQIDKGGVKANFVYGPEHQRTRQNRSDGTSVVYAGAQEVETKANGELTVKTYWPQGIGVEIDIGGAPTALHWTHDDHLGSPIGISDQAGILEEKLAYDAWGKRRSLTGGTVGQTIAGCGPLPAGNVTPDCIDGKVDNRGFTGHEMLDQLDLVHMNGRVYDPLVARFLSGDPVITDPMNGQSYNRYSYVLNNPTNLTDPTGFDPEIRRTDGVVAEDQPQPPKPTCSGGYCEVIYQNPGDSAGTASNKTKNKDEAQKSGSSATSGTSTTSENLDAPNAVSVPVLGEDKKNGVWLHRGAIKLSSTTDSNGLVQEKMTISLSVTDVDSGRGKDFVSDVNQGWKVTSSDGKLSIVPALVLGNGAKSDLYKAVKGVNGLGCGAGAAACATLGGRSVFMNASEGAYTKTTWKVAFMHEFGHNLGLSHRPNTVPSIMNYKTQKIIDVDIRALFNLYRTP